MCGYMSGDQMVEFLQLQGQQEREAREKDRQRRKEGKKVAIRQMRDLKRQHEDDEDD